MKRRRREENGAKGFSMKADCKGRKKMRREKKSKGKQYKGKMCGQLGITGVWQSTDGHIARPKGANSVHLKTNSSASTVTALLILHTSYKKEGRNDGGSKRNTKERRQDG